MNTKPTMFHEFRNPMQLIRKDNALQLLVFNIAFSIATLVLYLGLQDPGMPISWSDLFSRQNLPA